MSSGMAGMTGYVILFVLQYIFVEDLHRRVLRAVEIGND